jgi:hypothetical protein
MKFHGTQLAFIVAFVVAGISCKPRNFNNAATKGIKGVKLGSGCTVDTDDSDKFRGMLNRSTDVFKTKVLPAEGCTGAMRGKNPYKIDEFMRKANCRIGPRAVVSEKGQVARITESGVDPRTVDAWFCGATDTFEDTVYISGPGDAMHIIAFDPTSKTNMFYSADHAVAGDVFFHGNSLAMTPAAGGNNFRHSCTDCHVGGGLLMKELRFPWVFWNSGAARLVESVPKVQGAVTVWNAKPAHPVNIAEFLERDTITSITRANNSLSNAVANKELLQRSLFVAKVKSEKISIQVPTYRDTLFPLFCDRSVTIAASPSNKKDPGFVVPPDLFLNRLLVPNAEGALTLMQKNGRAVALVNESRLDMTGDADTQDFGAFSRFAMVDKGLWMPAANAALTTAGQDGDGPLFPMTIPARGFADDDWIPRLVQRGIIEESFAQSVLMVDIHNPVFSEARCGLLKYFDQGGLAGAKIGDMGALNDPATAKKITALFRAAVSAKAATDGPEKEFLNVLALGEAQGGSLARGRVVAQVMESCKANMQKDLSQPAGAQKLARLVANKWAIYRKDVSGALFDSPFASEDFVLSNGVPAPKGAPAKVTVRAGCLLE